MTTPLSFGITEAAAHVGPPRSPHADYIAGRWAE